MYCLVGVLCYVISSWLMDFVDTLCCEPLWTTEFMWGGCVGCLSLFLFLSDDGSGMLSE